MSERRAKSAQIGAGVAVAAILCCGFSVGRGESLPPQHSGQVSTRANKNEELLRVAGEAGRRGGRIVIALKAEPKTLNPMIAADTPSREVISCSSTAQRN